MKSLSEHITVDVYGKCGKLSCDRSDEGRSHYLIWAWARMVLANCCAGATACSTPATSSTSVWRTACARDGKAQKIHFIHHTLYFISNRVFLQAEKVSLKRTKSGPDSNTCTLAIVKCKTTEKIEMILSHHQCQDYITEKFFNILQYNVIPGEEMMVSQIVYLN